VPRVPVSTRPPKVQLDTTGPLRLYDRYARGGTATSIDGYIPNVLTHISALSSDTTRPAKLYNQPNVDLLEVSDPQLLTHWLSQGIDDHLPFVPESASVL
jgi:hypothetical protein